VVAAAGGDKDAHLRKAQMRLCQTRDLLWQIAGRLAVSWELPQALPNHALF
jgi:hypothetical protein